ncbi:MAG: hypothetical protein ABSD39_22165 [Terriglobales bacterium]|jgi:peptidoglycan/LPS O-acetylase OafA/YrhL
MSEKTEQWPNLLVGMVLAGIAIAIAETATALGVGESWIDPIVYTFIVFVMVTGMLSPAWRRKEFWGWLSAVFVVHAIGMTIFEQGFPSVARKFDGISLWLACMAEALVIAALLARKLRRPQSERSKRINM